MAVSQRIDVNTGYRDTDTAFIKPGIDLLNPRAAANLVKVIQEYDYYPEMTLDLSNIKVITNVAARMLCKALYSRQGIMVENTNEAVFSSLNWAADYLYKKGELDYIPWQINEMVF